MYHTVVSGLSTIAVPTFFGITGYFSYESSREKVMLQISRILKLYLCWSFIYLPLNYYSLRGNNQFFMLNIAKYFQNAFFRELIITYGIYLLQ